MAQKEMGYSVQVVTPAVVTLATLAETLAWTATTAGVGDPVINLMTTAISDILERQTRRQLFTATMRVLYNRFPRGRIMAIPCPPLQSVTSIQYLDVNNALQTFAASNYIVDVFYEPGRILLLPTARWPDTYDTIGAVRILYVAGYVKTFTPPLTVVPPIFFLVYSVLVRHFIKVSDPMTADMFQVIGALFPPFFERMLSAYRVPWDPPD